ncbi:MAG: 50S ribosomal protein L32 [Minisyncoccia bacterium]
MRHTRAHTKNRRSHHALASGALVKCECGAMRVRHRACLSCGRYRGRVVIDVAAKASRRAAKVARKSGEK